MLEVGEVLVGERVRLRPMREGDLPLLQRWFNDPDVRHWLHQSDRPDATLETVRKYFWQPVEEGRAVAWVVETRGRGGGRRKEEEEGREQGARRKEEEEARAIGTLRLLEIDRHHHRAELAISIGEKEYWGRGLGTDAIRLVLRRAFEGLGLRRISLITDADNERGIRCYEKCGFVREGLLRQHRLRYGKPIDMVAMAVLGEEFERPERHP